MAVELFLDSTATGSRTVFRFYCRFLMAVEVAVEMAVEFQSGSRKAGHPKNILKFFIWILFPEITLGDIPKIINFQKYPISIEFHHYGFCFHKSRSVTSPNGLGFCFRKTRPVTFPDFCWCSTLCLIISQWWRHKHDNLPCTYTPTGDLSVTYDVTVQMSLVTSLVTKKNFWILFPKITVGDIPEMLSIWVKM